MPKGATLTVYKGAGPGSQWWTTDPRVAGFSVSPVAHAPADVVRHITSYSHPSPYLSVSYSFAVAREYALEGPAGFATASMPGYVYEIDVPPKGVTLYHPIEELASAYSSLYQHLHDGGTDLIHGIAAPYVYPALLTTPPARKPGSVAAPPMVTDQLRAMIHALRDAEILVSGTGIPAGWIKKRHDVY